RPWLSTGSRWPVAAGPLRRQCRPVRLDIEALLFRQDGLIRHDQLGPAGLSRAALRWRLDRGRWRRVLPRIYPTNGGGITPRQRLLAAQLYAGEQAQITGAVALSHYGLRYAPRERRVRVLVPSDRRTASAEYVRIHRASRLDPYPREPWPLVLTRPARAVIDAGRWCGSRRTIRAFVAEAIQKRLVTLAR